MAGISQNDAQETAGFLKDFGIRFPVLLDDMRAYPVSNAYGLTNVPTVFWIAQDGEIEVSSVGWIRRDMEELNQRAAEVSGNGPKKLFLPSEEVADFRAG